MPRIFSGKMILFFALMLIADISIVPFFHTGMAKPIFTYLMVPYAAYEWHWTRSLPVAMMAGLLRDLVSVQAFGAEVLALGIAALFLNFLVQKMAAGSSLLFRLLGTFAFVFAALLIQSCFHAAFLTISYFSWNVVIGSIVCAGVTTMMMPCFFFLARRWFGKVYASTSLGY